MQKRWLVQAPARDQHPLGGQRDTDHQILA